MDRPDSLTVFLEHPCVRAIESYQGKDISELSFDLGDEIIFYGSDESGYADGEANGKRGWFPSRCIDLLEVISKVEYYTTLIVDRRSLASFFLKSFS